MGDGFAATRSFIRIGGKGLPQLHEPSPPVTYRSLFGRGTLEAGQFKASRRDPGPAEDTSPRRLEGCRPSANFRSVSPSAPQRVSFKTRLAVPTSISRSGICRYERRPKEPNGAFGPVATSCRGTIGHASGMAGGLAGVRMPARAIRRQAAFGEKTG